MSEDNPSAGSEARDVVEGKRWMDMLNRGEFLLVRFGEDYTEEERERLRKEKKRTGDPRGVPVGTIMKALFPKNEVLEVLASAIEEPVIVFPKGTTTDEGKKDFFEYLRKKYEENR